MEFLKMKYQVCAITCILFICFGCKKDNPETLPQQTYTKEWTLDINEYLGLKAHEGMAYDAAVTDQSRMVVSHNNGTTGSLVEIDYATGTFIRTSPTDKDSLRVVFSNEQALLVHEQVDTKMYSLGFYNPNNDSPINFFATFQNSELAPKDGQLIGLAPGPPETIYTYGSKLNEDGVPMLWIANWYYEGPNRWTTVLSHLTSVSLDPSTVDVHVVTSQQLIFSVETENRWGNKQQSLMYIGAHSGYFDWELPNTRFPINHMVENSATGFVYLFYPMGYSIFDLYGDETHFEPMQDFSGGTLTTKPLVIFNSTLFAAVHQGDDIMLVSYSEGQTKWKEKYWQKNSLSLKLLSTQKRDGVLVIASNGFITKYKLNK